MKNTTPFESDYKVAINNILKDMYKDTDYWGGRGITKPITDEDDPKWSNYNFINSHYTVRDEIILPELRRLAGVDGYEIDKTYKESKKNADFFRALLKYKDELFSPESPIKDRIIETINITRKRGGERESTVEKVLDSLPFISNVEMVSAPGSLADLSGIDARFDYKGNRYDVQIKPLTSLKLEGDSFILKATMRREYTQPILLFAKQDGNNYNVAVFANPGEDKEIVDVDHFIIPKKYGLFFVNYDLKTGKYKYKEFNK